MSHLRPSLLINDVYGSAGEVTAYHKGGKCFLRKWVGPKASTAGVAATCSAVHLRALEAWRALPHDVQRIWNDFARDAEPHRPPFDHSAHISGNNLFVLTMGLQLWAPSMFRDQGRLNRSRHLQ